MACLTSPLRALARSRPQSAFSQPFATYSSSSLAGPSRISAIAALSPARAALTTSSRGSHTIGWSRRLQSSRRWNSSAAAHRPILEDKGPESESESGENLRLEAPAPGAKTQQLAQIQPRLSLTFTCTADDCGHRSTHEFSKQAYTKGIVLVQCPSCKNRHLIADHLGWFKESTEEGTLKTIEDLLKAKGETVRTGRVNWDGDIEYDGETKAE